MAADSKLKTFVLFNFFGQSANTFYAFNMDVSPNRFHHQAKANFLAQKIMLCSVGGGEACALAAFSLPAPAPTPTQQFPAKETGFDPLFDQGSD